MATGTAQAGLSARTPLSLMADRAVGPFMAGKALSVCGNWVEQLGAAVLMYQLTHSALLVGAVSAAQFAPPFVLALWSGALSDRFDRRRLLMIGRMTSAAACAGLGVPLMIGGVDGFGGEPVLLISVAVIGLGHAIGAPAMQALVHDLVPPQDLEAVLALNSVAPSLARTVGPAAGAGLLLLGGPGLTFAVAAGAHLAFVAVLQYLPVRRYKPHAGKRRLLGGFHYLRRNRPIALLILAVAMVSFGSDPVLTLSPKLADSLDDEALVGLFVSAFGVGAVLLTVGYSHIRRLVALHVATLAGFLALGAGLGIAGLFQTRAGAMIGFCVAGSGFMLAMVSLSTRVQRQVPDQVRGRVMALWSVAFLGARPLTGPVNGAIADLTSVGVTLLIAAAVVVVCGALLARVREGEP